MSENQMSENPEFLELEKKQKKMSEENNVVVEINSQTNETPNVEQVVVQNQENKVVQVGDGDNYLSNQKCLYCSETGSLQTISACNPLYFLSLLLLLLPCGCFCFIPTSVLLCCVARKRNKCTNCKKFEY